jgi:hypothetical protein
MPTALATVVRLVCQRFAMLSHPPLTVLTGSWR